jgi:hypothetical protein
MRNVKHAERGQALVETAVFLPLFLLALFGIMWSAQAAVQSERTQLAVRYSGLVSQEISPYLSYSLYAMYTELGSTTLPTQTCVQPLTSILGDGAPYTSSQTTTASQPFWVPLTSSSATCNSVGIVGAPAGSLFIQPVVVSHMTPSVTSNVSVPASMQGFLGTLSSAQANGNFFKGIGEDVVVTCFPVLNTAIKLAMNPLTDTTTSTATPTALGSTVTATAITANTTCTSST